MLNVFVIFVSYCGLLLLWCVLILFVFFKGFLCVCTIYICMYTLVFCLFSSIYWFFINYILTVVGIRSICYVKWFIYNKFYCITELFYKMACVWMNIVCNILCNVAFVSLNFCFGIFEPFKQYIWFLGMFFPWMIWYDMTCKCLHGWTLIFDISFLCAYQ